MRGLLVCLAGPAVAQATAPLDFYTVTPCRLVDTRNPDGSLGGPALVGGTRRDFTVTGVCGIPVTAVSLSVNVTVAGPAAGGFLGVFSANGTNPGTSTINFSAGQTRANNAVVRLATDGSGVVSVQNGSSGAVPFILDVNGYFSAPVGPPVGITTFTAAKSTITTGSSTTITPEYVNATSATIDNGVGSVNSGTAYTVTPAATTTYTLTANGLGGPVTQTVTIIVVPAASITGFAASPTSIVSGGSSQLTATFYNGTGVIDHGVGAVSSTVPVSTGALNASTTYTLTVTNTAGDSVTAAASVTVSYLVTFVAGSGGSLSGTSAQAVSFGGSSTAVTAVPITNYGLLNWTGTGGFVTTSANPLTVSNVTSNMTITANYGQLPVIGSFWATSTTIGVGFSAVLNWSNVHYFTSASIDNGGGPIVTPNGVIAPYPSVTTTYTLTASNTVGTVTQSVTVTVVPKPTITSFTATPPSVAAGQTTTLSWSATGAAAYSIDQGIGTVVGNSVDVVPPTGTTTYTLTANNGYGSTKTATTTVTSGLPTSLIYSLNPAVYSRGAAIVPNTPSNSGGAITGYVARSSLPAGLNLVATTGVIIGTPTAITSTATYTVRGSNALGYSDALLSITVNDAAPSISYPSGSYTFFVGAPVTPVVPTNSGGAVVSWSIAPALPPGLTFNTANGTIGGTPTASAAGQGYTVTATNTGGISQVTPIIEVDVTGPTITVQPHGQILTVGAVPVFSVAATGTGTLTYQWSKNGTPIGGATSSTYTAPAFILADDGAAFSVVVSDSYGGAATSDSAILSVFQDLATWLGSHPTIADAIKWQIQPADLYNSYAPPTDANKITWANWSASQQADLDQAYIDACAWYSQGAPQVTMTPGGPELTDQPTNLHPGVSDDSQSTIEWVSPAYMWKLYVAQVGFSLMLEISHQLPWTVTSYPDTTLKWLFDSSAMAWDMPSGSYGMGTYDVNLPTHRADNRPRTTFADPRWTYPWLKQAGIVGSTRLATIGGTLDWMRQNMTHFYGSEDFGADFAIWQYRGYSPLSQIVNGTVDSRYPDQGIRHWTAGCHGSTGFLHAALRVLNIPVQPIWVCNHELVYFMSEDLYMDHADDPYNGNVRASSASSLLLLIDLVTYQSRFGSDVTVNILDGSSPACSYIGYTAINFH